MVVTPKAKVASNPEPIRSKSFFATNILILFVLFFQILFFLIQTGHIVIPELDLGNEASIKQAILEVEYDKVGGKENYEIITELQKRALTDERNPQNIAAMKEYLETLSNETPTNTGDTTTNTGDTSPDSTAKVLTSDQMTTILQDAVLEGDKDADIVLIEYSDFECPYCIKLRNDIQPDEKLQQKYAGTLAFAFKNHRGVNHSGTEKKALGALCSLKVGGEKAYQTYQKTLFEKSSPSMYPVDQLGEIAKTLGIDTEKWEKCVNEKETLDQFQKQTQEGITYVGNGTPGTLIFNKKTGAYATVSGAYDVPYFEQAIETIK